MALDMRDESLTDTHSGAQWTHTDTHTHTHTHTRESQCGIWDYIMTRRLP